MSWEDFQFRLPMIAEVGYGRCGAKTAHLIRWFGVTGSHGRHFIRKPY